MKQYNRIQIYTIHGRRKLRGVFELHWKKAVAQFGTSNFN